MKSRFHELASAELTEAVAYYDTKTQGLGDRLMDEVRAAVAYIEDFPESSPVISRNVRRKVLAKFPYDIFYVIGEDRIEIVAVAHESRRPRYWRGRVG